MTDSRIWSDFIFDLKAKSDIVDVISSYLQVVQKGKGYWALCPFHNDRNPSMSINKDGQYYHCFVCNAGGDVISFVQNYESCTFLEAVEILAKRARMEVPQFHSGIEKDIADKKRQKDECLDLCLFAAKFYNTNLWQKNGEYAVEYLKKRGLSRETIKRFGLGLSNDWDGLCNALQKENKNINTALKAGLVSRRDDGKYFDSMAQRLIVPIFDINGNVIAFGGRTFSADKNIAKYKNTSVTPLFDKSKTLYALNFAKKAKQHLNLDYLIIVEGYMDAIALHQAGFVQTVASMGTSLTEEQARQAKRLVKTVYICYDGDTAGRNATLRGLDILKKEGLEVRVVSMPEGVDPDEYVKQNGVEGFRKLLFKALPLIDYKLTVAKRSLRPKDESKSAINEYRRKFASQALEILKPLSEIDRESYLPSVSTETGMSVDFLRRQFSNESIQTQQQVAEVGQAVGKELKAIAFVLACKLNGFSFAQDDFTFLGENLMFNTIFDMIKQSKLEGRTFRVGDIYRIEGFQDDNESMRILMETEFLGEDKDQKAYLDCIDMLKKLQLKRELKELTARYSSSDDIEQRRKIATQIELLMKKINAKV